MPSSPVKSGKSVFARYRGDKRGVTAIEFAIVALPFFMLVLGIIEFGLAFLVNSLLDNATQEASRLIRTGQAQNQNLSKDQFKTAICNKLTTVLCDQSRLYVDVRNYPSFSSINTPPEFYDEDAATEADKDKSTYLIGGAEDIVLTRVTYRWPMFSSMFKFDSGDSSDMYRNLSSTVVFKSEPFQ
ncbi:MAG: pilus assembly protein [Rhodobacteraceae bacterium]|nr:pilus assembly protein [Paracoccaceae bacterium]